MKHSAACEASGHPSTEPLGGGPPCFTRCSHLCFALCRHPPVFCPLLTGVGPRAVLLSGARRHPPHPACREDQTRSKSGQVKSRNKTRRVHEAAQGCRAHAVVDVTAGRHPMSCTGKLLLLLPTGPSAVSQLHMPLAPAFVCTQLVGDPPSLPGPPLLPVVPCLWPCRMTMSVHGSRGCAGCAAAPACGSGLVGALLVVSKASSCCRSVLSAALSALPRRPGLSPHSLCQTARSSCSRACQNMAGSDHSPARVCLAG